MTLLCGLGNNNNNSIHSFDELRAPEMPETLALKLVHLKTDQRPALMDLSQKTVEDRMTRSSRVASLSLSTSNLADYKPQGFFEQRTVFAAPVVMSTKEFSSFTAAHEMKRQTKKAFNHGYLCVDNNPQVPIGNCM
ncbi:hypothetical protein Ciccas_013405 [Cichlidogyrus casuarinus]|uniref:Uncharacterized protein n=1 Tax=Cichlidogyrus casuarinus TaxID=1844966 RepID=A0ABD2PLX4_9PLAT